MEQLTCYVEGIGLLGPGIENWQQGSAILTGRESLVPARTVYPVPQALPATERRRTGQVVKLALVVGQEAVDAAGLAADQLPSVFASSGGDNANCHAICEVLATEERIISPTRFHNSVVNAPAGYWSIATGCQEASNVVSAFDASFVAGLLEALTQVMVSGERCVLLAYDIDYPEPLHAVRPISDGLGIALVLAPQQGDTSLAKLSCTFTDETAQSFDNETLESIRRSIPAARGLPLLQQWALGEAGRVVLDYFPEQRMAVEVTLCR